MICRVAATRLRRAAWQYPADLLALTPDMLEVRSSNGEERPSQADWLDADKLVDRLQGTLRVVFAARLGLPPFGRPYTSTEIAQRLRLSRRHIERLLARGIRQLRPFVNAATSGRRM